MLATHTWPKGLFPEESEDRHNNGKGSNGIGKVMKHVSSLTRNTLGHQGSAVTPNLSEYPVSARASSRTADHLAAARASSRTDVDLVKSSSSFYKMSRFFVSGLQRQILRPFLCYFVCLSSIDTPTIVSLHSSGE